MNSPKDVRSLVCSPCWQDFFNTEHFQRLCLCQCLGANCANGISGKTTMRQINESANNGCNWCSYIRASTSIKYGVGQPDDVLTIYLTDNSPHFPTPIGKNAYNIRVRWLRQKRIQNIKFHAFTKSSDLAAPFVTARKLQYEVYSDKSRQQIQSWLAECAVHDECSGQIETILPTRVIEVAPAGSSCEPRLLVSAGKHGRYVALSYCWGGKHHGELNRSN
jgi:hypothetical protein